MANLTPKRARALYALKTDAFRRGIAPEVDELRDAAVISEKVRRSSCFGAAVTVIAVLLAAVAIVAGVL